MRLSAAETRQLLYCAAEELRARARGKPPGPQPWLAELVRRLELEVAVSGSGHEFDSQATDLSSDDHQISAREAAVILGRSKRQAQRLAADLDGQIVGGRWVFRRSDVEQYAEGLTHGRLAG